MLFGLCRSVQIIDSLENMFWKYEQKWTSISSQIFDFFMPFISFECNLQGTYEIWYNFFFFWILMILENYICLYFCMCDNPSRCFDLECTPTPKSKINFHSFYCTVEQFLTPKPKLLSFDFHYLWTLSLKTLNKTGQILWKLLILNLNDESSVSTCIDNNLEENKQKKVFCRLNIVAIKFHLHFIIIMTFSNFLLCNLHPIIHTYKISVLTHIKHNNLQKVR